MIVRSVGMLLLVGACGTISGSKKPDPLLCLMTFEKYAILAEEVGDDLRAKGLHARQIWYGEQARKLPDDQRSDARIHQLADQIYERGNKDIDTVKTCIEQQDADPDFKVWRARR